MKIITIQLILTQWVHSCLEQSEWNVVHVKFNFDSIPLHFYGTNSNQIDFKDRLNYVVNDFNELVTKFPSFKENFAQWPRKNPFY